MTTVQIMNKGVVVKNEQSDFRSQGSLIHKDMQQIETCSTESLNSNQYDLKMGNITKKHSDKQVMIKLCL